MACGCFRPASTYAARADADAEARLPVDEPSRERVSGWWGVLGVIVPIVAVAAAVVFLLLGYVLGNALVVAGWVAAAVGAVSLLVGGAGLLGAAARGRGGGGRAGGAGAGPGRVAGGAGRTRAGAVPGGAGEHAAGVTGRLVM
ncbi:hypothetical protein BOQ63_035055 [Streptomyces viridifaciens]|uniref:hypothetical protein n=1 Tax=Kitasatospora aureofaciens TaxID=1894 RepID=UPI000926AD79|nr:hypothetical protein CP971_28125 [Streptomyces viridifaciens]UKZ09153.1 hypothetical protein BOQ63_035055 [Streptomyces viridifaciens]